MGDELLFYPQCEMQNHPMSRLRLLVKSLDNTSFEKYSIKVPKVFQATLFKTLGTSVIICIVMSPSSLGIADYY